MLAKVALRRALPVVGGRSMSVLSEMSAIGEQSAKMAATLPDSFKSIAEPGVRSPLDAHACSGIRARLANWVAAS